MGFLSLRAKASEHQIFAHWGLTQLNTELLNRIGFWTDGGHRLAINEGHSGELNQTAINEIRISFAQRGGENDTASSYDGGAGLYVAKSPASWALDERLGDDLLIVEIKSNSPINIHFLGHNSVKQNYLKYRKGQLSEQNLPIIVEYLKPDAFIIQRLPRSDENIRILVRPPTVADAETLWKSNTEGKTPSEILHFIGMMSFVLEQRNYVGGTLLLFERIIYQFGYNFIQNHKEYLIKEILTKEEKNDLRKILKLYLKKQDSASEKTLSLIQLYKAGVLRSQQNDWSELEDIKGFEMIYDFLTVEEKNQFVRILLEEVGSNEQIIEKQTYRWIRLASKISSVGSNESNLLIGKIKEQVLIAISRKSFNAEDVQFQHIEGEASKVFGVITTAKENYNRFFSSLPLPLGQRIEKSNSRKISYIEYESGAKQSFYQYKQYPDLLSDFFTNIFDQLHADQSHPELMGFHFLFGFKLIYARLVSEEVKQKLLPILQTEFLKLENKGEVLNSISIMDFEKVMLDEGSMKNFTFQVINDIAHGICIDFRPLCEKLIKDLESRSEFHILYNSHLNFDPRGLAAQLNSLYPHEIFLEKNKFSNKKLTCGELFN